MSDVWNSSPRGLSMWRSEWGNMKSLQEQIDSQIESAASTQRRLSSQLSKLQGDLSQRVDRLSRAFDAFVELSQLRDELGLHVDARRWRIAAKRLVESKISRGPASAGGGVESLDDVPGYWLAPAVRALPDTIEGGAHAGELDEAARRDELRTATFVAAVAPLLGTPALADVWTARAFGGSTDPAITSAQRALWLAAADGLLPAASRNAVRDALAVRLARLDAPARDALVADLAGRPPVAVSAVRSADAASGASAQSAAVAALGQWCGLLDAVTSAPAAGQTSTPPSAATSADGTPGTADLLLDVVRSLVEEGSVEERPLLGRAEQLSAIVDPTQAPRAADWEGAAGNVGDLLAIDLRDGAHPARRRLALSLLRDAVGAAADRLVDQAATEPATSAEMRIGGRNLRVTAEGGDPAELAAATAPPPRARRLGPVQLGIGGVVVLAFIVLAIAVAPGWAVVAVLGAAGLGGWWFVEQREERRVATEDAQVVERARQQVAERSQALVAAAGQARDAAGQASALRDQLRSKLAALAA